MKKLAVAVVVVVLLVFSAPVFAGPSLSSCDGDKTIIIYM